MTWALIIDGLSWISFLVGGFFLFVGSLGMVRLKDFWARLHGASILDSAGVGLILFGMMLQAGLTLVTVKLIIIVIFLFLTGPTASHAVANAAFVSGSRPPELIEDVTAPVKSLKTKSKTPKKKPAAKRKTPARKASKT